MSATTKVFSAIIGGNIDRAAGVIRGVSVITVGDAKGHGIKIDHRTLETVLEVGNEFPNGVKVKFRHKTAGQHQSVIDEVGGVLKQFSIKGNKTIADFYLLKSLPADTKEKLFEMAETMPDQFGFSIDFTGVSEEKDGVKFARCEELNSVDLSDKPAANPDGLFEEKPISKTMNIKYKNGKDGDHDGDCKCNDCKSTKMESQLSALTESVAALAKKLDAKPAAESATLSFVDGDGKTVTLNAKDISDKLATVTQLATDTKTSTELSLKKSIIEKMGEEGRVAMNPKTSKAYTLAELQALPIDSLQFAAINSPMIPLEAKAIYQEGAKPAVDPKLKGSDKVVAALEAEGYGDYEAMKKRHQMA